MATCSITLQAISSHCGNGVLSVSSSSFKGSRVNLTSPSHRSTSKLTSSSRRSPSIVTSSSAESDNQYKYDFVSKAVKGAAALSLATLLQLSPLALSDSQPAFASEYNILNSPPPLESHVVDDAGVLSRLTKSDLKRLLTDLETRTGYHIDFVTLRKITIKGDVFELADKVIETWYPTLEEGTNKAVVLLVTTSKEGAVAGGPAFNEAVGDEILEAVVSENLPVLATEEKYNEALYSTAKRLVAKIDGQEDLSGPRFDENKRISNYKTKEETESKRGQFTFVVGGLLVIAFVVPMAQYYAYVSKK